MRSVWYTRIHVGSGRRARPVTRCMLDGPPCPPVTRCVLVGPPCPTRCVLRVGRAAVPDPLHVGRAAVPDAAWGCAMIITLASVRMPDADLGVTSFYLLRIATEPS